VEMYNEASCLTNYPTIYISKPQYKQKVAFLRIHLFLALSSYPLPAPRVDSVSFAGMVTTLFL
jgi:hypothetical protein